MAYSVGSHPNVRLNFSKIEKIMDIPNLIDVQKQSYEGFLQKDFSPEDRQDIGMQAVFKSVFPIRDFNETASLEFVSYSLGEPKYEVDECRQRGMTFAAPLKVVIRLITYETDEEERKGRTRVRDIKEQEVYFGEIPLMTDKGTFVINGTERVIVSQLHRSPGILFEHEKGKTHTGKPLFSGRIIPHRGSWLDLEFDTKGLLYVRIDRRRKLPVTILLRALGYSSQELLNYFYHTEKVSFQEGRILKEIDYNLLANKRAIEDLKHPQTGELLIRKNRKITRQALKKLADARVKTVVIEAADLVGRFLARDVRHPETGEVLLPCNTELTLEKVEEMRLLGVGEISLLFIDQLNISSSLRDTLASDRIDQSEPRSIEEHRRQNPHDQTPNSVYNAILEIYRRLRPSEPPTLETAKSFFDNLFFNPDRYDLSRVGRLKINHRLKLDAPLDCRVLRREDILEAVRYLIELKDGTGEVDDIDHLGNRRVRAVGELLENQYRIGLVRMERAIKERMSLQDVETLMPHDLINPKPVSAVIKEFFGSSRLSQFKDQTNPLTEITHKRRLTALGPGGLTRERAGFEVRDVHPTHYGRICPIETPEGPNIGLIASLSTYGKVDSFGFIVTPYRKVADGKVTQEIEYLSALQEDESRVIAQANAPVDEKGRFTAELIPARVAGESTLVRPEEITHMDVSPTQLVSVAASLIPFLENDDANRALMGSNMQRQAVPLLRAEAPLVGTGMEGVVARDSGVTVVAERDGVVEKVDSSRIIVRADHPARNGARSEVDIYNLVKYQRSNQNTCINQKPVVREGERVVKGQIIADGPATENGELALGRNVLVAFMPWGGYNFEDSILISERVVKDDSFTSIHIEEFEVVARDTKLGREEITQDIPNLGDESLKNLDESGIIRIGAEVKPGDILVGKITPKGETQPSPEEKLLRAIFGEKAGAVKDTSLRVPPGVEGIVIGAKVFSRRGVEKDTRAKAIEEEEIARIHRDQEDEIQIVQHLAAQKVRKILLNEVASARVSEERSGKTLVPKNTKLAKEVLAGVPDRRLRDLAVQNPKKKAEVEKIWEQLDERVQLIQTFFEKKIARLKKADELPPGVIKMVKVDVAIKRKLSVGDKMAGRHGNKGVISRILPEEDMPYLEDGTAMDIVLNPLGVPSRMNVGQILETHLGWAAQGLGAQISRLLEKEYGPKALREKIKKLYDSPRFGELVDSLDDEQVSDYARGLGKGLFMASPAFDGATEEEIKLALKEGGRPVSGQASLHDGRSGEAFDQKVTVGVIYMMKLHHLVDDKIHARSVGPYSLITQQPLGGKAQFGGQRLGEMEVWALEAYGAAYALQEFLTVKSDDVLGRTRMYETIVKGGHNLEAGVPESFNVLVKELQSLCLDMELLEKEEA
ncbi:MAG: DNA-directed RNA polymerase subunit beta [Deltaproteobacteria bacterium]|nr:DNA-directed RNA polymerase subunit beta [Deltaproteobacteria bacterium]